ncbi:MAG: helix-turn-helix domain-containing protein [Cyclobacteriaceae bacterium]|nr:helix-turn-helix domain-containing protein [Cyclobacteriaceae bacterium]
MQAYIATHEELEKAIEKALTKVVEDRLPELIQEATSKPWLNSSELLELTGWSSRTLQNMRDRNEIPYSQHGRKILYPRADIMRFLRSIEITPRTK